MGDASVCGAGSSGNGRLTASRIVPSAQMSVRASASSPCTCRWAAFRRHEGAAARSAAAGDASDAGAQLGRGAEGEGARHARQVAEAHRANPCLLATYHVCTRRNVSGCPLRAAAWLERVPPAKCAVPNFQPHGRSFRRTARRVRGMIRLLSRSLPSCSDHGRPCSRRAAEAATGSRAPG